MVVNLAVDLDERTNELVMMQRACRYLARGRGTTRAGVSQVYGPGQPVEEWHPSTDPKRFELPLLRL